MNTNTEDEYPEPSRVEIEAVLGWMHRTFPAYNADIRLGTRLGEGYERHIVLSDYHHREYSQRNWVTGSYETKRAHDPAAMAVVEQFMADYRPTHIHYLGDMVDFFTVSRFCQSRPDPEEVGQSLGAVRRIIAKHRDMFPDAQLAYYLGNHEARWQRYIETQAEALSGLVGTTYNEIFQAADLHLAMHRYRERVPILPRILELTHGDKVRAKSGYTAHAMLDRGVSGVSGHTHRLSVVYKTTRAGMTAWGENGCLCDTRPAYLDDPDWQQGFSVLYVDREAERFRLDAIPIVQTESARRIIYGGHVWEAEVQP